MRRELVVVQEVLKSLKIFSASGEESALSNLGVHSAPSSALRILGASPKFKIVDFYGQVRAIKPYSPIALFVALNTSLKGPKIWIKSVYIYPEHPSTSYMGAEADACPTAQRGAFASPPRGALPSRLARR